MCVCLEDGVRGVGDFRKKHKTNEYRINIRRSFFFFLPEKRSPYATRETYMQRGNFSVQSKNK